MRMSMALGSDMLSVDVSSKVPNLDKDVIRSELAVFASKQALLLGSGTLTAHVTKHKETTRKLPSLFCRLHVRTSSCRLQTHASGYGEQQCVKQALHKLKSVIHHRHH